MRFTPSQQKALAIAPKPSAVLSFLASIYIIASVVRNERKRRKMYHRLILGMSFNSLIQSFVYFLGTWPIPRDAAGFYGAAGTVETCTAQGFMLEFAFAVPFYYASLSLYAFLAVRNDFKEERIVWIEKYIHVGVFVLPLTTAIMLAKKKMLNPVGPWCWIESYPMGCNGDECIRGTDEVYRIGMLYAGIPIFCFLGFSTLMMIILYWTERNRRLEKISNSVSGKTLFLEEARCRKSKLVARQASLYLAAFYLTYIFSIIANMIKFYTGEMYFPMFIIGNCFVPLMGFLNMIVYFRLQLTRKTLDPTPERKGSSFLFTISCLTLPSLTSTTHAIPAKESCKSTVSQVTVDTSRSRNNQEEPTWCREEFSIFDGTNPSDKWKEFILDDSDEEEADAYDIYDNGMVSLSEDPLDEVDRKDKEAEYAV